VDIFFGASRLSPSPREILMVGRLSRGGWVERCAGGESFGLEPASLAESAPGAMIQDLRE
jgi:hypothetical protein